MIDETTSDPSPESGKPIALGGGSVAPGEAPPLGPERQPEPASEPLTSEPLAATPGPAAAEPLSAPRPVPRPTAGKRSALMPLLGLLGFVILAAAIAYMWVRPARLPAMPAMPPNESGAVAALQSDVAALKTKLAALDARETSDVAAVHAAIAALPRPAATSAQASTLAQNAPPGQNPTASQAATSAQNATSGQSSTSSQTPTPAQNATSGQNAPSGQNATSGQNSTSGQTSAPAAAQAASDAALLQTVTSLSGRLDQIQSAEAAQAQQTRSLPSAGDVSKLASRVDDVAQRESNDDTDIRQDLNLVRQQLAALSGQAQTLAKTSAAVPRLTAQADRLGQILRAQDALRAGLPLGSIDNAPPALSRFADAAPPTEAALRLSFASAAQAADKAGEPTPDQGHFWHRVWLRAQNLVMVRQGDHVVLGDPTSAILAHAQTVLDAGDLAGALSVVGTLNGPAADAMAPWESQARALLQARAALSQMAAG